MFNSCQCLVVVGSQWGDEGKGKIVDVLSESADVVVRYQGGANAGHTVVTGDDEFILHQVPSGILHDGTTCVIGNGVVLDPATLVAEIEGLTSRGIAIDGRLKVSDRAHMVMPFHRQLERSAEKTQNIGTTGRGIGPTYEDKSGRRGFRVGDLLRGESWESRLNARVEAVNEILKARGSDERADVAENLAFLSDAAAHLTPLIADTGLVVWEAIQRGGKVLLEGAQGALLDVDHGTYPFVTSSNTTAGGATVGAGIGPTSIDVVLGIVKAYTTRVGNGPFPSEAEESEAEVLRKLGGEFGATTGRPRRCGWFDAVVMNYARRVNGITHLAVTKLDVLDTVEEIKICVRYEIDGRVVEDFPSDIALLERARPVYESHPGWVESTADCRRADELPARAKVFLERLRELAGVPLQYVSVGSRRDQIITIPTT